MCSKIGMNYFCLHTFLYRVNCYCSNLGFTPTVKNKYTGITIDKEGSTSQFFTCRAPIQMFTHEG